MVTDSPDSNAVPPGARPVLSLEQEAIAGPLIRGGPIGLVAEYSDVSVGTTGTRRSHLFLSSLRIPMSAPIKERVRGSRYRGIYLPMTSCSMNSRSLKGCAMRRQ